MIEIKDEILCKTHFRKDGTGTDFLYIVPVSLREEVFQHIHTYITAGLLGRSKTYEKMRQRFYWCNIHRDVSYCAEYVLLVDLGKRHLGKQKPDAAV